MTAQTKPDLSHTLQESFLNQRVEKKETKRQLNQLMLGVRNLVIFYFAFFQC